MPSAPRPPAEQPLEPPRVAERAAREHHRRRRRSASKAAATRLVVEQAAGERSPARRAPPPARARARSRACPCAAARRGGGGRRCPPRRPPSTSRCASSTPARSPGRCPGRSFTVTGRPLPSRAACAIATALSVVLQQRGAGAGLADLAHRAAHVQVDQVGARGGHHRGGLAHDVGVVAEELHRHRVLVGMDAQELAHGALVAVGQAEARHHLGHHEAGAVAPRLQPDEPVADAGQRREHEPVARSFGRRGVQLSVSERIALRPL